MRRLVLGGAALGAVAACLAGCGAAPSRKAVEISPGARAAVRTGEEKGQKTAPESRLKRIVFSDGMSVTGLVVSRSGGRVEVRTAQGKAVFPPGRVARIEDLPPGTLSRGREGKGSGDGLEAEAGWEVQSWGNGGEVIRDREWNGNVRLRLRAGGGDKDKAAICLKKEMDLSGGRKIVFDIFNVHEEPVGVAVAVMTGPGWEYFETRTVTVPPGWVRDVTVDTGAKTFKCQATGWKFEAAVRNPDRATHLFFLVYNKHADVEVVLDRVRVE